VRTRLGTEGEVEERSVVRSVLVAGVDAGKGAGDSAGNMPRGRSAVRRAGRGRGIANGTVFASRWFRGRFGPPVLIKRMYCFGRSAQRWVDGASFLSSLRPRAVDAGVEVEISVVDKVNSR
jgi:hypothetical protein